MILAGGSGCGKSTLLLHMVLTPRFLDYERLYIFTSTPKQEIYQFLYHGFSNNLSKEILSSVLLNQDRFKDIPIPMLMKKMSEVSNHIFKSKYNDYSNQ
jgi:energy-coupling factor transporter ATP-binding protein EcfA2